LFNGLERFFKYDFQFRRVDYYRPVIGVIINGSAGLQPGRGRIIARDSTTAIPGSSLEKCFITIAAFYEHYMLAWSTIDTVRAGSPR
jgi:hypothetical protein